MVDPVVNPYRPGAGRRPPRLAGRRDVLDAFEVVRRRAEEVGEGERSWVLNGLRGVGKTVLLSELLAVTNRRHWITAKVEAGGQAPIGPALGQALVRSLRTATGRHQESSLRRLLGVLKAFSLTVDPTGALGVGVDVEPVRGVAASGRFGEDLTGLLEAMGETAREVGVGVLLLVDEMQEASPVELAAINSALHSLGQEAEPLPVVLVGAGLPSLPAVLAEATSYGERLYDHRPVGLLDPDAARDALVRPARDRGVEWTEDGLVLATRAAGGYPYFLQSVGKHVWDSAVTTPITGEDVEVGLVTARREVDDGLYRSRWERATPAQRALLRALGDEGGDGPVHVADLARRLGRKRTSDISVARHEVIRKGLVYAPQRGQLAFTVPGMHDFIARQP